MHVLPPHTARTVPGLPTYTPTTAHHLHYLPQRLHTCHSLDGWIGLSFVYAHANMGRTWTGQHAHAHRAAPPPHTAHIRWVNVSTYTPHRFPHYVRFYATYAHRYTCAHCLFAVCVLWARHRLTFPIFFPNLPFTGAPSLTAGRFRRHHAARPLDVWLPHAPRFCAAAAVILVLVAPPTGLPHSFLPTTLDCRATTRRRTGRLLLPSPGSRSPFCKIARSWTAAHTAGRLRSRHRCVPRGSGTVTCLTLHWPPRWDRLYAACYSPGSPFCYTGVCWPCLWYLILTAGSPAHTALSLLDHTLP